MREMITPDIMSPSSGPFSERPGGDDVRIREASRDDDVPSHPEPDRRHFNEGEETEASLQKEGEEVVALTCRNERYEGQCHPDTGVPYVRKTIEYDGKIYEGVFPEFDSAFDANIPEDKFNAKDREHIAMCNAQLKDAVENDPDLKAKFTEEQLEQIANGDTPDGYTWHHTEEPGKMQLVDTATHQGTGHTGGRVIWGGGGTART